MRRRAAQAAIRAIEKRWREPDYGVWEIQDERWTQSRLACVAGLRAVAKLAGAGPATQASRDCVHRSSWISQTP
ncbi:hypothetical protein MAHJHV57_49910 [Mycobacterium avium subsp. hominissuis]